MKTIRLSVLLAVLLLPTSGWTAKKVKGNTTATSHGLQDSVPESTDQQLDALFGKHEAFHRFFVKFKQAVIRKDCKALSLMAGYPLLVTGPDAWRDIYDPGTFIQDCDTVMTRDIYRSVKTQQYKDLFVNYQGAMIGRGEVWFTKYCIKPTLHYRCDKYGMRFITINQQPIPGSARK